MKSIEQYLSDEGIHPEAPIEFGKPIRWGGKSKEHWLFVNQVGEAYVATYGNWKSGQRVKYIFSERVKLSKAEKAEFEKAHFEQLARLEEERRKVNLDAAELASELWSKGTQPKRLHPYLVKKGLTLWHGARQLDNLLMVPIFCSVTGEMMSLQRIWVDKKRFLKGSRIAGGCFKIGSGPKIYLCEGFSTGASIYEAIGSDATVIVSFDCENMKRVAKVLFDRGIGCLVCADNDHKNSKNVGLIAAEWIRANYGFEFVLPECAGTDFNDMALEHGLDAVKGLIERPIARDEVVVAGQVVDEKWHKLLANGFSKLKDGEPSTGGELAREVVKLRDFISEYHRVSYCPEMKVFFCWQGTHFRRLNDEQMYCLINGYLKDEIGMKYQTLILKMIRNKYQVSGQDYLLSDKDMVNFANGIYLIGKKKLIEHNPKFKFSYCLPVNYLKDHSAPVWDQMLNAITMGRPHLQLIIEEFIGFALSGCAYAKGDNRVLFLDGKGSNGKTTLIQVIRALFTNDLITATSLDHLQNDSHAVSDFEGKLLSLSSEISPEAFTKSTSYFKQLSGGDPISANPKNLPRYMFINYAKMIVSYNKMPKVSDDSEGFFRRPLIVPCEQNFKVNKNVGVKNPVEQIIKNGELDKIASRCIDRFESVWRTRQFTSCPESELRVQKMKIESNQVEQFFNRALRFTGKKSSFIPGEWLLKFYREFVGDDGLKARKCNSEIYAYAEKLCEEKGMDEKALDFVHNKKKVTATSSIWGLYYFDAIESEEISGEYVADNAARLARNMMLDS